MSESKGRGCRILPLKLILFKGVKYKILVKQHPDEQVIDKSLTDSNTDVDSSMIIAVNHLTQN